MKRAVGEVSLERALSKRGLASRSQARRLILEGRVRVDGATALDPLQPVVPERVAISIDNVGAAAAAPLTIAFHKPRGVVTTRSDPEGRPTVYDWLTDVPARVVPVGRLDFATSGLLLFSNDTRFADWVTDPRTAIPRVYLVTVRGHVEADTLARLRSGVVSRGERLAATTVELRKASSRESHLVITLTEGKNREIRRLLEAVGHPVTRLRRVQFGGITLDGLAPGGWRPIEDAELRRAFPLPQRRKRAPSPK